MTLKPRGQVEIPGMFNGTLDCFKDWESHNKHQCQACALNPDGNRSAMTGNFDLDDARARLALLEPDETWWAGRTSHLSLFDPDAERPRMNKNQLRRFLKKIEHKQLDYHTPCWLWAATGDKRGHGRFYLGVHPTEPGTRIISYAHRVAFEHWIGSIPQGLIIDHQCNHPPCVNPTHLWPETNRENLRLANERKPWKRNNQYSRE